MDAEQDMFRELTALFRENNIAWCFVGEVAMNYYNAPLVTFDYEICVPSSYLEEAANLLASCSHLFAKSATAIPAGNICTEYKIGYPRFEVLPCQPMYLIIYPDTAWYLNPLPESIVPPEWHSHRPFYSKEIRADFGVDNLRSLPFPKLPNYFRGLCKRLRASESVAIMGEIDGAGANAKAAIYWLIDGMDLDQVWAEEYLATLETNVQIFIKSKIDSKRARLDSFSDNIVTTCIATEEEASCVRHIPGRDEEGLISSPSTRSLFMRDKLVILKKLEHLVAQCSSKNYYLMEGLGLSIAIFATYVWFSKRASLRRS